MTPSTILVSDNNRTPRVDGSRPLEAYDLVGRDRAHLLSASCLERSEAVSAFTAAIEINNTYAAAHAGLARARCGQAVFAQYRTARLRPGQSVCPSRARNAAAPSSKKRRPTGNEANDYRFCMPVLRGRDARQIDLQNEVVIYYTAGRCSANVQ